MGVNQSHMVTIEAQPEAVHMDLSRTAVLVVDMQNAFVRKGGYFDLVGIDISGAQEIIEPCQEVVNAARDNGIKIIYLQMGCSSDFSDKGAPDSPGSIKSRVLSLMKQQPELKDKMYIYGTWGSEIIDELKPQEQDIVVKKQKYDGFIGTNLDIVLRTLRVKYLVFIGTATNICIESTLRHAFFLDYFPILVADAVSQMGPGVTQKATIINVQTTFGWVTRYKKLLDAICSVKN